MEPAWDHFKRGMKLDVFTHVTVEKAELYRDIMGVFSAAKAHFLVHLRPEDVHERLVERGRDVSLDAIQTALAQLVDWNNLRQDPDTSRVTSIEEFYRARYIYQITREGEAAERALEMFDAELGRRGALQAVALEDIRTQLRSLVELAAHGRPDPGKVRSALRALTSVFTDLADNARAFMAGLARTLELRGADRDAFIAYKDQLIGYIERFLGDLVAISPEIASLIEDLETPQKGAAGDEEAAPLERDRRPVVRLLAITAAREAEDMSPEQVAECDEAPVERAMATWLAHWRGLRAWFVGDDRHRSQASLLRARARKAISDLLDAVVRWGERQLGRSDRAADFRALARWMLECPSDEDAHRLWRSAFGMTAARHLTVDEVTLESWRVDPIPASRAWPEARPIHIRPRLRATGSFQKRGALPKMHRRHREKAVLAQQIADESARLRAARSRLATGQPIRLSDLGQLDDDAFRLLLELLGAALGEATGDDAPMVAITADGSLEVSLESMGPDAEAQIDTPVGVFRGRDYAVRITDLEDEPPPRGEEAKSATRVSRARASEGESA